MPSRDFSAESSASRRIDTEALRERWPLDELAERYGVQVHGRGSRRYARCPFHLDRSPSLVLYLATRTWFCFGCRQWGDAIDWVARLEGLDFLGACEFLGARLEPSGPVRASPMPTTDRFDRHLFDRTLRVLRLAADVYHDALPSAPEACRYLRHRGVGGHGVHWAHVGYSTGRDLLAALKSHGIRPDEARDVGLLNDRGREVMCGRITVPVIVDGRVLTMTGRAVLPRLQRRYLDLSLPPHALGMDLVRDQQRVVLVEGVTDYLVALEWRIPAISAMGTHASSEVRAEIRDATIAAAVVPLALDDDEAGEEAGDAWMEWLGPKLAPVIWPRGIKDVGDLGYLPEGAAIFRQMLAEAEERWRAESTLRPHPHAA